MDKCPLDFISLVKICVLIQSLELILERGGLVERENPVFIHCGNCVFGYFRGLIIQQSLDVDTDDDMHCC